jgi:hypothetical protein
MIGFRAIPDGSKKIIPLYCKIYREGMGGAILVPLLAREGFPAWTKKVP